MLWSFHFGTWITSKQVSEGRTNECGGWARILSVLAFMFIAIAFGSLKRKLCPRLNRCWRVFRNWKNRRYKWEIIPIDHDSTDRNLFQYLLSMQVLFNEKNTASPQILYSYQKYTKKSTSPNQVFMRFIAVGTEQTNSPALMYKTDWSNKLSNIKLQPRKAKIWKFFVFRCSFLSSTNINSKTWQSYLNIIANWPVDDDYSFCTSR